MQIQIDSQPYSSIQADALVTYVFEGDNKIDGVLAEIDRRMTGGLATLVTSGEITGKALETVLLHFPEGMDAKRLLLVGAGKPGKFAVGDLRKIAGAALRYLKSRGVKISRFSRARENAAPLLRKPSLKGFSSLILNPISTARRKRTTRRFNPSRSPDSETVRSPESAKRSSVGALSPNRRISRATSSTNLPTALRRACLLPRPKPWPRKLAWALKFSMTAKSPS